MNEPETAPELETDRRVYLLTNRAGAVVQSTSLSVGGSAVELTAGLATRRQVFVKNFAGTDLYVGDSGVSTSNGYLLRPKEEIWLALTAAALVYGRTGGTTADVRVLEVGS